MAFPVTTTHISKDNEFTGGFCMVIVAIPESASISRATKGGDTDDDDEDEWPRFAFLAG